MLFHIHPVEGKALVSSQQIIKDVFPLSMEIFSERDITLFTEAYTVGCWITLEDPRWYRTIAFEKLVSF